MKIAVYTCVTGGYDRVSSPSQIDDRLTYHCWTDLPQTIPEPWQIHAAAFTGLNAKDTNRYVKMNPHQLTELHDCDFSVYVDSSIDIVGDVHQLVIECQQREADLAIYEHPFRDCLYDEAMVCADCGHSDVLTLRRQMHRYKASGFPAHAGLFECNVLVRRNAPIVDKTMGTWWHEYRHGARRDQLSITWSAWINGLRITSLGRSDPRYLHNTFRLRPHARTGFNARISATKWSNRLLQATGIVRI